MHATLLANILMSRLPNFNSRQLQLWNVQGEDSSTILKAVERIHQVSQEVQAMGPLVVQADLAQEVVLHLAPFTSRCYLVPEGAQDLVEKEPEVVAR